MTAATWLEWYRASGSLIRTAERLVKRFAMHCPENSADLARIASSLGLPAPKGRTEAGAMKRAMSPRYWRAWMKVEGVRNHEQRRRRGGQVRKGASLYVSEYMLQEFIRRDTEGRRFLEEEMLAISDHGDELSVAELADASPTKPEHKRAELMVRTRGFEEYGEAHGHPWTFATLTLPGEWHCYYADDEAHPVPHYNGSRPDECQRELNLRWQRCRADLHRAGVRFYGMRVVEPHHDGTPHWHILLWAESEARMAELKFIMARHFGTDPAALDFEDPDPDRGGSAAGYIAKYVSKNIDGAGLSANDQDGAQRAVIWSRIWRARQFQQLGGPPVSVWRELRRVKTRANEIPTAMRPAFEAAVAGDWAAFVTAMGGPFAGRGYAIELARGLKVDINGKTSPEVNAWGEPLLTDDYDIRPTVGLRLLGEFVCTYSKVWTIERRSPLRSESAIAPAIGARTRVSNCTAQGAPP